ncbi:ribonuclease T2-like [Borealophlyctis nickersoniae]|nr:ribonuclease T2-like [Borealophlyctis nickersoniae]
MSASKTLILAVLATTAAASPLLQARQTCPANAVACDSTPDNACCVADNGVLIIAQQWLKGYCAVNSCSISSLPSTWTMHGVWPDTCSGSQVSGCTTNNQWTDVESRVSGTDSTLYSNMKSYWISYTGDNNAFWSHEWSKHGTCYSPASQSCVGTARGADVDRFFKDALNLRTSYPIYTALSNAGINPTGVGRSLTTYKNAIANAWPGIKANFICSGSRLYEIRLAVWSKTGGAGAVGASTFGSDSCPSTGVIY